MILAFTGTRTGMTPDQRLRVRAHLTRTHPSAVHHGDCIGADAEFHAIALSLGIPIVIHPPVNPTLRAFCAATPADRLVSSVTVLAPRPYLDRNRDMVDLADVLLATPARGRQTGGTWRTVTYARRIGRRVLILHPTATAA